MNIFKVLANGDGRLDEANISAFLGYLLNPYEDHGLGFEFLQRFIQNIVIINNKNFYTSQYEYEILFEQAFIDDKKDGKNKEIVDIVILCFENNIDKKKESLAKQLIQNSRELKYIYLIENKINPDVIKKNQLAEQFNNTVAELDKLFNNKSNIVSIYITPDDPKFVEEFSSFTENEKKQHLFWISAEEYGLSEYGNENTIYSIIKSILVDESKGNIEAINEYTKHTMISFVKFIESGFKSQLQEKKGRPNIYYSLSSYMSDVEPKFNENTKSMLFEFDDFIRKQYPRYYVRHSETHPLVLFTKFKSGKVFGLTGRNLRCQFVIKNNFIGELKKILDSYSLRYTDKDWGCQLVMDIEIDTLKKVFYEYYKLIENAATNN